MKKMKLRSVGCLGGPQSMGVKKDVETRPVGCLLVDNREAESLISN